MSLYDNNKQLLKIISDVLLVSQNEVKEITVLKKGMTNRSFLFTCRGKKYIMRIPGEGTDELINRKEEAEVYRTIADKHICDDVIYISPDNGYKITEFLEGARVCNPQNTEDLTKCMAKLRAFHELKLTVNHEFNIFDKIEFYEQLWKGTPSLYNDYKETKENVFRLKSYIDEHIEKWVLTHIDAVPDNFLFVGDEIRLIDWEYAGMQDPHVDIAMFCIYSFYDKHQIDQLINIYFEGNCPIEIRVKIYCYISACGLLWSNWCEYKRNLGVEFGEYALCQYRYAKEYYKIAQEELNKIREKTRNAHS
jgi:thiamine kinase-like enzyme